MKRASKRLEDTNDYALKRWSHSQPARALDPNLKSADIPKYNPLGKVDFHACRVAYINLLLTAGYLSPIEGPATEGPATGPERITRPEDERLRPRPPGPPGQRRGTPVRRTFPRKWCTSGVPRCSYCRRINRNSLSSKSCDPHLIAPVVGLEPERTDSSELTDSVHNCANSIQNSAFRDPEEGRRERAITEPGHNFAEEQQQSGCQRCTGFPPQTTPGSD